MSYFLKKAGKARERIEDAGREPIGKVTKQQVREIAEQKMKDLNCKHGRSGDED